MSPNRRVRTSKDDDSNNNNIILQPTRKYVLMLFPVSRRTLVMYARRSRYNPKGPGGRLRTTRKYFSTAACQSSRFVFRYTMGKYIYS